MSRVCIFKASERTRYRKILLGLPALLALLPYTSHAAAPPTPAQCNGALFFVTEQQQLNFGGMLAGVAGTVTVDYKGGISSTGPTLLASPIPLPGILVFSTSPPLPAASYDCSNTTPLVTFTDGTLSNGSSTMTITNFTYSTKSGNPFSKFNLGYFYIGADLVVGAGNTSGTYTTSAAGGIPYGITLTFQ